MSESELTAYLKTRYSEQDLEQMYLMRYEQRLEIKAQFRRLNVIVALVIGLIWARNNVRDGDWGTALVKIAGCGAAQVGLNQLLYAHDATAAEIMAQNVGNFGKWFKGAARANRYVTRFTELAVISTIAQMSLSGGGEYPSIPWDLICDVDLDNEKTWEPPPSTLLQLGFNWWYRVKDTNIFLCHVDGSLIKTILENTILSKDAY